MAYHLSMDSGSDVLESRLTDYVCNLLLSKIMVVGGEKVSFPTNEIYVGLGGLNRNSTMGLMHGPKAISEDPRNSLYFMPWL